MTTRDLGPLAMLRRYASGGPAESEGPAADQNDKDIAGGSFGGGTGSMSQSAIDHASNPAGTGSRGMFDGVLSMANDKMDDKASALGIIGGGFLGGPAGMMAGTGITAMDRAALSNAQDALTPGQLQDLLATGTPQIDAHGHSHGVGPGGTNNGGQGPDRGASGPGTDGPGATPVNPTDPAAGATPSTRYIPGTGDYEKILIRKDGTRTDLAGTPLTFAAGGATGGASPDAAPVSGLFAGGTPGRADLIDTMLPEDSYILPADTVSAAGEGNTEAGALSLARTFGQPLVKHASLAQGPIRAKTSAGEFYVSPADVKKAGGADALDKMVRDLRKHYAKNLAKLPGPKK